MIRKAAVAGSFYPYNKTKLIQNIEECFKDTDFGPGKISVNQNPKTRRKVFGGICPHAGYVYSGSAAAYTIKAIFEDRCPDSIIILGTQHTGYRGISLMQNGAWETPLGQIPVDSDLANSILSSSTIIKEDDNAFSGFHGREHNIEVQIPFIQYAANLHEKDIKLVPIKLGDMNLQRLEDVGIKIGSIIKSGKKDIAVISSSDMTHKQPNDYYQPAKDLDDMYLKDKAVMDSITQYNLVKTFENALSTTVCGPQTIVTGMIIAKELGATAGNILKYYTSYEKMGGKGPCEYCVGYLSAVFT
ncbi:MAG: AmmeMemoRadiSam system protein B [Promethearchaeota archaeon]|nr:MAG: AmmeMemoRadiSam system protein B [Candidatus Lokiarchaeota archaeon]